METPFLALIILFVITPVLVIYLEGKFSILKKIGAVLICYGVGLIIGNMDVLPHGAEKYQNMLTDITIPLALPLILFSVDVRSWFKMARSAFLALVTGLISVLLIVIIGFFIFRNDIENSWQVAGMLVGVYTGGTPNMAAMKTALNVSQELYIMTHTYDLTLGAIYLVFILSIGQKVFLWFLPPFKPVETEGSAAEEINTEEEFESYDGMLKKKTLLPLLGAFGISVAILGVSYGISLLLPKEYQTAVVILLITTFGIAFSFVPKIKAIKKTFQLGMYLILIFCLTVASMADISKLSNISFSLFYYVALAVYGSHIIHIALARIFKIDADTVIISTSALICSPPFVPVVAGALKNRQVILTGLVVGIAGYAVGNYLGVLIAYLLK
ncbi:Uncharacterized membrane protein [Draconibacterium orientale]|uniref:Uncharacterized membrane protein n=1 Tax=Draconibacterium orientale TaxID=1168034 RepID=X5DG72_9BACT|nr:DUF819 family protein [Draconibacterium orientale]AHW61948.1 hypothetical protein FH5T_11665 [Draconibacterium orientale]SEU12526.1 Uncharacterized membrane protein [Draconibacterium orientale]